jgi:murein DD-endopeptidase MepM/ murein hydrolase activator NlpD
MAEPQGITAELYRAIVTIVDDRVKEIRVTREDFDRLTQTVAQLAQAQARTEQRLEELAQAQARTEQRLNELAQAQARTEQRLEELAQAQSRTDAAVQQLVQAQARTEQRVEQLEGAMQRLAEAQARTEERLDRLEAAVERLAEAQARTEERVDRLEAAVERLAEAQARTEQALQQLATQVGALSDNVGYGLEDIARVVLPGYLKQRYGVTVERLERRIFPIDGQQFDIDLYAEGRRGRRRIVVLGEVKARIYAREVHHFQQVLQAVRPQLPAEPLPVLFGYFIDLSAMEAAQDQILLIAAYQPTMEATAPRRRRRTKRV